MFLKIVQVISIETFQNSEFIKEKLWSIKKMCWHYLFIELKENSYVDRNERIQTSAMPKMWETCWLYYSVDKRYDGYAAANS